MVRHFKDYKIITNMYSVFFVNFMMYPNDPHEVLTKFGYKSNMKVYKTKCHFMFLATYFNHV